ncbi:ABC transporter ATP-binding protein [Egibacter rhizosphaerae]|uniref:ABC transporter ATP-binding protein n=1 Tax=Egibacter rhizosphaerae TaxID=1670831 RepID=A0A411YBT6_9ACTN|nr:ABC transporter ATP-binding protein [Egibacter rhizosphaerae]QBI18617.1 ABC transporter ATP-binding protein [Egibacter rhizosphaerae]
MTDAQTRPPPEHAIAAWGVRKTFGTTVAADSVDLAVPRGALFGLVGPNGAGKTTFLRAATGLLRPDSGQVFVEGVEVWEDPVAARSIVGVLPEDPRLFDRLSGMQLLTYTGQLFGLTRESARARATELLNVLELSPDAGTLVVDYSQGMRKKIGLAAAMIHGPRVLFLDEPFESVDPVSARTIRGLLQQHVDNGGTIVLSSHVMELVERLCDHLGVIHQGRVVAQGPTEEVRGGRRLDEVFADLVDAEQGEIGLSWL